MQDCNTLDDLNRAWKAGSSPRSSTMQSGLRPPVESKGLLALQGMFPGTSDDAIRYALRSRSGNVEEAATYLLDDSFPIEFAAVSARAGGGAGGRVAGTGGVAELEESKTDRAVKARLMARYDEQVDTADKTYRPALPSSAAKADRSRQMRYWCVMLSVYDRVRTTSMPASSQRWAPRLCAPGREVHR